MNVQGLARLNEEELDWLSAVNEIEGEIAWEDMKARFHPATQRETGGFGGSTRWPFDIERAIMSRGYRFGVLRAMRNPYFHPVWRANARHDMHELVLPKVIETERRAEQIIAEIGEVYGVPISRRKEDFLN